MVADAMKLIVAACLLLLSHVAHADETGHVELAGLFVILGPIACPDGSRCGLGHGKIEIGHFENQLAAGPESNRIVGFTVCNEAFQSAFVAYANDVEHPNPNILLYRARGWRQVAHGDCEQLWSWTTGRLGVDGTPIEFFIYAEGDAGGIWGGYDDLYSFCTPQEIFDITSEHLGGCRLKTYLEIDMTIGDRAKQGYTLTLRP
jgi:hypothetical protein